MAKKKVSKKSKKESIENTDETQNEPVASDHEHEPFDDEYIIRSALSIAFQAEMQETMRPLRQFVRQIVDGHPPTQQEVRSVMKNFVYGNKDDLLANAARLVKAFQKGTFLPTTDTENAD